MTTTIHSIFKNKIYNNWLELEVEIARIEDNTEKGDVFEQFCFFYLQYFKDLYQIDEIYSPKISGRDIPRAVREKLKLAINDDGVDGVMVTNQGKYIAYQAKFRSGRVPPSSNELNDFWSEAEYADYRLVIANSFRLPTDTTKRRNQMSVLVDKFENLDSDFFHSLYYSLEIDDTASKLKHTKFTPKPFQTEIINSVSTGFEAVDRGKVIAACASGKTLVSMWISEELNTNTVLFLAPNLALVRQSIERWAQNYNESFIYLAVCSDMTVGTDINDDDLILEASEVDVPVTTDPDQIKEFMNIDTQKKRVIFSTYQSVDSIAQAMGEISGFEFDLIIFDEAHRTAGSKEDGLFTKALKDEIIPAKKRLFMTATERLVKPWIKDRFEQQDRTIFSMDDEAVYGPTFYKLTFGDAIKQKIISDYKIIVTAISNDEYLKFVHDNNYLSSSPDDGNGINEVTAQLILKALMFCKSVEEVDAKKVVSFHSTIKEANSFVNLISSLPANFLKDNYNISLENSSFLHVNGSQPTSVRQRVFNDFENSEFGLLSNVRCLTEGVDMPFIDGVLFADPRGSMIDIVQAVGRALRKPLDQASKTAYIMIPIILDNEDSYSDTTFAALHSVIQALRDQDESLAEWIDDINISHVRGKGRKALNKNPKFKIILPQQINLEEFSSYLSLRISEVNSRPSGATGLGATLGKKQRKSEYKRVFKSIGDYNAVKYKESLVDPTLAKFEDHQQVLLRSNLLINNNNISHAQRLGVIGAESSNNFKLTEIGKAYKDNDLNFPELFCNQMLLYKVEENGVPLFPYRIALKILLEVKTLNYIEFLYSIYSVQANLDENAEIIRAVQSINHIRQVYPHVMDTNPQNQETVQNDLNGRHRIEFSERDIWTDRTTAGNQYRFFLNHIIQYEYCFDFFAKKKTIEVTEHGEKLLKQLLEKSEQKLHNKGYIYGDTIWIKE